MSLPERHADFLAALREHGLGVSTAEGIDAARALEAVDLLDRDMVRVAYAATLVKRSADLPVFHSLFDLWFPPALGDGQASEDDDIDAPTTVEVTGGYGATLDVQAMRGQLAQALFDGDDTALEQVARRAVARYGSTAGLGSAPGSWSPRTVLDTLDPLTLLAGLMRSSEGHARPSGTAGAAARSRFTGRIHRFEHMINAEAHRRIAEQRGERYVANNLTAPALPELAFLSANQADLASMRRAVHPMAHALATRIRRQRRQGTSSTALDFRRTMRGALATGGVPIKPQFRPHRPHKPELVVLCDVSSSVANFAQFALLLLYTLHEVFTRTRAFTFVRDVTEVTEQLRRGRDAGAALAAVRAQTLQLPGTGTDHGRVFDRFAAEYSSALTPRTVLVVLGDARNNYYDPQTASLAALAQRCRRTLWLNPEPAATWGSGDSVAPTYAELVEMAECRNLTQLTTAVQSLA